MTDATHDYAIAAARVARNTLDTWWSRHSEDETDLPNAARDIINRLNRFIDHAMWLNAVAEEKASLCRLATPTTAPCADLNGDQADTPNVGSPTTAASCLLGTTTPHSH